jgi:hypothetical protein
MKEAQPTKTVIPPTRPTTCRGTAVTDPVSADEAPLLRALGIQPAFFETDDDDVPPIDSEFMRQFLDGRLGHEAAEDFISCVRCYRPWYEALTLAVLERARAR